MAPAPAPVSAAVPPAHDASSFTASAACQSCESAGTSCEAYAELPRSCRRGGAGVRGRGEGIEAGPRAWSGESVDRLGGWEGGKVGAAIAGLQKSGRGVLKSLRSRARQRSPRGPAESRLRPSRADCQNPKACGTCNYKCGDSCVVWHMGFKHPVLKHNR
eukprot:352231-Chlamydomonas_euryale.AAC.7